jgi:hypothetical protein
MSNEYELKIKNLINTLDKIESTNYEKLEKELNELFIIGERIPINEKIHQYISDDIAVKFSAKHQHIFLWEKEYNGYYNNGGETSLKTVLRKGIRIEEIINAFLIGIDKQCNLLKNYDYIDIDKELFDKIENCLEKSLG